MKKTISKYTAEELQALKTKSKTNDQHLDQLTDETIDYTDSPEPDEIFWKTAQIADPGTKKAISLRIDPDVLTWFKSQGGRYQRLINNVLRHYMASHQKPKK